jgi:hypothetical protein
VPTSAAASLCANALDALKIAKRMLQRTAPFNLKDEIMRTSLKLFDIDLSLRRGG